MPKIQKPTSGEFKIYQGLTYAKVVEGEDGLPIINPSREEAAKYMGFSPDGDEIKYTGERKINYGYADLSGKQLVKLDKYNQATEEEKENMLPEEEIEWAKVRFLMETKVGTGEKRKTHYFFLDFMMYNTMEVSKKGDKAKAFNNLGQVGYVRENFETDKGWFKNGEDDQPRWAPRSLSGNLGFEELVNFIYAYTAQPRGNVEMLDLIDVDSWFEGDFSSIVETFKEIHEEESLKVGNNPLYGVRILFTAKRNSDTRNRTVQDFYPKFLRGKDGNGKLITKLGTIGSDIMESRKPVSYGGKTYIFSPERSGVYFGGDLPEWGLKEVNEKDMNEYLQLHGGQAADSGFSPEGSGSDVSFDEVDDLPDSEDIW